MRSKARCARIGAGLALLLVVAVGAIRGAIYGNGDDYALHRTGADGAFLGGLLFAVFGGLPAALVGAAVGVGVAAYRGRAGSDPTRPRWPGPSGAPGPARYRRVSHLTSSLA